MCSPEEATLLRLEEVFLATLARISSLVLQPLLKAGESQLSVGKVGETGTVPVKRSQRCWAFCPAAFATSRAGGDTGIGIFCCHLWHRLLAVTPSKEC